jgi:hypothetical protein
MNITSKNNFFSNLSNLSTNEPDSDIPKLIGEGLISDFLILDEEDIMGTTSGYVTKIQEEKSEDLPIVKNADNSDSMALELC